MNDKKNGAWPVPDFSVFDGQRLLGLDRLGLRARSMRFLGRGDGSGVWQIRCDTGDESARACVSCGCMCRVRTSHERTVVHVPLGSDAIHLKVLFCFNVFSAGSSVFFRSVGRWFSPVSSSCSQ